MRPLFIIGAGAVGRYWAAKLASRGTPVVLIGRNPVLGQKIRIELVGAELADAQVPCLSWSEFEAFPPHAQIWLAVKSTQLDSVWEPLRQVLKYQAVLTLFQNGLGIWDQAQLKLQGVPGLRMVRGTQWVGVRRDSGNRIIVAGGNAVELASNDPSALKGLTEVIESLGVVVCSVESPARVEWRKALVNIGLNALCSLASTQTGAVLDDPGLRKAVTALIDEAVAVAKTQGLDLSPDEQQRVWTTAQKTAVNLNSMLQDLEGKRITEIESLNGAVVKLGKSAGLAVPRNELLTQLIRFRQKEFSNP